MTQLNTVVLVIGGAVLILGLFSKWLKRWGLPDPLLLLLLGILLGPHGFRVLDAHAWGDPMQILRHVAQLTLAIGLMGVALRVPKTFTRAHWRSIVLLLLVAMPAMWVSSSLIVAGMLGLSLWTALLLGAAITPTDPVVASSIVTGPVAEECLPSSLRHLLSAESGANDGLAYLFVLFPILMLNHPMQQALSHWMMKVLLWEVCGAVLLGGVIGLLAGWALRFAESRRLIEMPSLLAYTTALALTTLGVVELLGSDGILAVFIAGIAFDQVVDRSAREQEERVTEGVDRFFTLPIFAFLGLILPWQEWRQLGWMGLATVVLVLLLRRLPILLVLRGRAHGLRRFPDAAFAGWFGPIGVAALYYAALANHEAPVPELWPVTSLIVCASIVAHGVTATPLSRLYAKVSNL